MAEEQTKISQVIEAIITHPKNSITVSELMEQFPDWKRIAIQNHVVNAKNKGYLKPVYKWGKKDRPQIYNILKREPHESKIRKYRSKNTAKAKSVKPAGMRSEVDMETIGLSMVTYINKLKSKIQTLSNSYSDLQSELRKTNESNRITIKNKDKLISELKNEIANLRKNIRRDSGKTFDMSEIARFT